MSKQPVILVLFVAVAILPFCYGTGQAHADALSSATSRLGNDVSYPQCGQTLPVVQAFAVVGVNDTLANTFNPCFSKELNWAQKASGTSAQPKVSLYVNTANPGNLKVPDWPTSGKNKYGTCKGGDTKACAYQYGSNLAKVDTQHIGDPNRTGVYTWWLDVETGYSWETNTDRNAADLEGMVSYFENLGAKVGIYSNASEWQQIAGSAPTTSSLHGLSDWVLGAISLAGAESNCNQSGFTAGKVAMTQYTTPGVDGDYSCQK